MTTSPKPINWERIQFLNDRLRVGGTGGRVMITANLAAELKSATAYQTLKQAVRSAKPMPFADDPYGIHDYGEFAFAGHQCFWQIDCYDTNLEYASPDPSDEELTLRVMIIGLISDY